MEIIPPPSDDISIVSGLLDFELDSLSSGDDDGSSLGEVIPISMFSTISAGPISFTGPNNAGITIGTTTVKLNFKNLGKENRHHLRSKDFGE